MNESTPSKTANEPTIRPKVLLPLVLTLLFVLSLFVFFGQRFLERDLRAELNQHMATVAALFDELLVLRAETMSAAISQLAISDELQDAMRRGDRDLLMQRAQNHYLPLLRNHGIGQMYFHLPDGTVLVRMHRPELFGDPIERASLMRAAAKQAPASGIELGALGELSLRTVVPWQVDGELIGYIELGREIQSLIHELHEIGQSELIFLLYKEHLEQQAWQGWMEKRGHPPLWDLLSDQVVIDSTISPWDAHVETLVAARGQIQIEIAGRTYQGARLPLRDAGGEAIGTMVVLSDATERLHEFRGALLTLVVSCLALGGALIASSYITLGRADRRLAESRRLLLDQIESTGRARTALEGEIAERRLAEKELERARDELEYRVEERTVQLNDSLHAVSRVKDQLQGIFESVQDVLIAVDGQGRILQMNAAAEELLGASLAETRCRPVEQIAPPSLRETFREAIEAKGAAAPFDVEIPVSPRGGVKILQVVTSIIGRSEGTFGGMIFLARDVTRERQIDRIKTEFISTAAHELRTPVTSILGFSELLLQPHGFTAKEQTEFLAIIHEKADALSELIDDLLDVSRIEAGRAVELHRSVLPVETLIAPVVRHYQKMTSKHVIELKLRRADALVDADRAKVGQVMENLLSNAVKYSPHGGTIRVSGERTDGAYKIAVKDEGIGMSAQEAGRIFEKFFRADTTDSAVSGTGLGMTIVKSIVEAHGGEIKVKSARGKGTTVTFTLPLGREGDESPPHPS